MTRGEGREARAPGSEWGPGRGGGGHRGSGGSPPGARTRWLWHMKDDPQPAVLPQCLHELVGCEPRPRCDVVPRAGVLVLREQLRCSRGKDTAYHTAYTVGIEVSTAPAATYYSGGMARGRFPKRGIGRCRRG